MMESYFDRFAKLIGSGLSRRETLGLVGATLLGATGWSSRASAATLVDCNAYCRRYAAPSAFLACRTTCLSCPSTSSLCGATGQTLSCCNSRQVCQSNTCVTRPTCTDGIKNGTESDVDCGGSCTPCANGLRCNSGTDCQSKVCVSGTCRVPACNDGVKNGSETDVDCGGTCPKCANGRNCSTNNDCASGICTGGVCQANLCQGVVCTAIDQCHDVGVCNPGTGVCSNPAKVDGTACDDGNACTRADTCQSGVCVGSNPVVCTALDQCHNAGTCDPATGACSNPLKADGTACNDNNPCTHTDVCLSGVCVGTPVNCDDGDPCTNDSCDPVLGCIHTPRVCSATNASAACNSGTGNCAIVTCNNGFADCNGVYLDGCETNITNDRNNCGGCGITCTGMQSCVNRVCV